MKYQQTTGVNINLTRKTQTSQNKHKQPTAKHHEQKNQKIKKIKNSDERSPHLSGGKIGGVPLQK